LVAVTCLLLIYYYLKYQQATVNRLKASVGWGDVLMLPAFIVSFSPGNLIFVFILSLMLSLIYNLISNSGSPGKKTIPLAGIQSIVLFALLIADFLGFLKMQVDYFPLF
jgi:Ni/Fe-hydrogenase subunit HybB-like protein